MIARGAALAMLALGLMLAASGGWIHLKAGVAQILLNRAWRAAQAGEPRATPWPWADTWPVARLRARDHDVDLIVLENATGATMAFAPGRVMRSARPPETGNIVVAGHRDTHFAFLRDLGIGDHLELEDRFGRRRSYAVSERWIVDERDVSVLEPTAESVLTLVTCFPFDAPLPGTNQRYVVVAAAL